MLDLCCCLKNLKHTSWIFKLFFGLDKNQRMNESSQLARSLDDNMNPANQPTNPPTNQPTNQQTKQPSHKPTNQPATQESNQLTKNKSQPNSQLPPQSHAIRILPIEVFQQQICIMLFSAVALSYSKYTHGPSRNAGMPRFSQCRHCIRCHELQEHGSACAHHSIWPSTPS